MKTVRINNIDIDIHDGKIGLLHSGGADSAVLLYIMMKHATGPVHVYTCANKLKGRVNPKIALDVIGKCIDLTGNNDVYHHTYFVNEQTFDSLFSGAGKYLKDVTYLYTGVTALPPDDVLETFKEKSTIYDKRNPNEVKPLYRGKYYTPLSNINKQDVCEMYKTLGILDELYPLTRSCENPHLREGHCGKCWWCEERIWGFGKL